jgi:hypothetical protein
VQRRACSARAGEHTTLRVHRPGISCCPVQHRCGRNCSEGARRSHYARCRTTVQLGPWGRSSCARVRGLCVISKQEPWCLPSPCCRLASSERTACVSATTKCYCKRFAQDASWTRSRFTIGALVSPANGHCFARAAVAEEAAARMVLRGLTLECEAKSVRVSPRPNARHGNACIGRRLCSL